MRSPTRSTARSIRIVGLSTLPPSPPDTTASWPPTLKLVQAELATGVGTPLKHPC